MRIFVITSGENHAPPFATAFVVDDQGVIRAELPQRHQVVGGDFRTRDYVRGAVARAGLSGSDRVHFSRVFTSKNDGLDKLAVSVPFYPKGKPGPVYVLGATARSVLGPWRTCKATGRRGCRRSDSGRTCSLAVKSWA